MRNVTSPVLVGSALLALALYAGCSSDSTSSGGGAGSDAGASAEGGGGSGDGGGTSDASTTTEAGTTKDAGGGDGASGAGAFGDSCTDGKDCQSGVCFVGGSQSFCSIKCTSPSDCPVPPTSGQCNNMGYCKK